MRQPKRALIYPAETWRGSGLRNIKNNMRWGLKNGVGIKMKFVERKIYLPAFHSHCLPPLPTRPLDDTIEGSSL